MQTNKGVGVVKTVLEKKEFGGFKLPDFKTYNKGIVREDSCLEK